MFAIIKLSWIQWGYLQFVRPLLPACSRGLSQDFLGSLEPRAIVSTYSDSWQSANRISDKHPEAIVMLHDSAACTLVFTRQHHYLSLCSIRGLPFHLSSLVDPANLSDLKQLLSPLPWHLRVICLVGDIGITQIIGI